MEISRKVGECQIVAVAASTGELDALPDLSPKIDLVELRLDLLPAFAAPPALESPILLTARSQEEGGSGGSCEERCAQILDLLDSASSIDLEIATLAASAHARRLADAARSHGIRVIGSFHDFFHTPSEAELAAVLQRAGDLPIDLVKIAAMTSTSAELARLALLQEETTVPLATMGMGPLGKASRVLLAHLGSRLVYGYTLEPSAPGQWAAGDLRAALRND